MIRAALTGGIATGKSYCLSRFHSLGTPVIDADQLAREAVAPGSAGLRAVAERFGSEILQADGTLNRPALGAIVFSDRAARAALEAIIHPEVRRRIREWFAQLPHDTPLAIADIPLLFETGQEHDFDRVIVCACDSIEQLRRLMVRDGLSDDEARKRLAAQWPIEEKVARADFVIRTDGTHDDTDAQIASVLAALLGGLG
jgi:dephospho-CoA kinase